jgi:hypothetical protein
MLVNYSLIARILETKLGDIKKAQKVGEEIHVQTWNSKQPIIIPVQEYKDFLGKDKKRLLTSSDGNKKGIGSVLIALGVILVFHGCAMDTTVSTGYGSVHNVGLIEKQNQQVYLGGIAFLAGVILCGLGNRSNAS